MAADHNLVDHNLIIRNNSLRILVANVCNPFQIPPEQCSALDIQPNADGDRVVADEAVGNGTNPAVTFPLPGADLAWDGTGTDNGWARDAFATTFPALLPSCG